MIQVTAVHDEGWLLDRTQIVVGSLLLDAPFPHRFDLGGRRFILRYEITSQPDEDACASRTPVPPPGLPRTD